MATHQRFGEVELGTVKQFQACLVDDHACTIPLNDDVVGFWVFVKGKAVLKAATSAGQHFHPERGLCPGFLGGGASNLCEAGRSSGRDGKHRLINTAGHA